MTDALALLAVLAAELLRLAGYAIAVSNADDLALDLLFLSLGRAPAPPLAPDPAPAPFAILVPAWREAEVIGPMLRRLLATIAYDDYTVFVGVYPNDGATLSAVTAVRDPRVRCVRVTSPGPTTKADCLNQLWRAALAHVSPSGHPWAGFVLHDAEDVVPADGLRIFQCLADRFDMVQLPVQALPDRASRWVSGHYIDEFAESHFKELPVRAALGLAVPSAGVGCMVSARALSLIAAADGLPFAAASLTEDYQLGHRLKRLSLRATFARVPAGEDVTATREFFPATLHAALRQKTRWLLGIALDGWDTLGWDGTAAGRWMLWRDRKGLLTALLSLTGYAATAVLLGVAAALWLTGRSVVLPDLVGGDPVLGGVLLFNLAMVAWRLGWRAACTRASHGWREGVRSVPRALVGNAINGVAALRAVGQYRAIAAGRRQRRWDKTEHRFPVAP